MTYKLSFRIGEGMVVDLDPAVGAGLVTRGLVIRGDEIRTRPRDKSSKGRSLGSN